MNIEVELKDDYYKKNKYSTFDNPYLVFDIYLNLNN